MIKPLTVKSLTDEIESAIYNYIKEQGLKAGDAIPNENELAEMLQISRPMVREAISRLRMLGIICSRKKRGMIVSKPLIFKTLKKVVDPHFLKEDERKDFFNLRLTIEIGLGDLLVKNITNNDIKEMTKTVELEMSAPADYKLYIDCDCKFHTQIYQATRSNAIMAFQSILNEFFGDYTTRVNFAIPDYYSRFENPKRVTHLDILNAIKTKDAVSINNTMRQHLAIHFLQEK